MSATSAGLQLATGLSSACDREDGPNRQAEASYPANGAEPGSLTKAGNEIRRW